MCNVSCSILGFNNLLFPDFSTFYYFDPTLYAWYHSARSWGVLLPSTTLQPLGRAFHAAAMLGGNYMIITGGQGLIPGQTSGVIFSDVWMFSMVDMQWTELSPVVPGVQVSAPGVALLSPTSFVVFGGSTSATFQSFSGKIFQYVLDTNNNENPLRRYRIALTYVDSNGVSSEPSFAFAGTGGRVFEKQTLITFGGQQYIDYSLYTTTITLGCNMGDFSPDFTTQFCDACRPGTFTETAGSTECQGVCPSGATTPGRGSISIANCSRCVDGFCKHGSCSVQQGAQPSCQCHFGFQGNQCDQPVFVIAFMTTLTACILLLLGILIFRKFALNYRSQLSLEKHEIELRERLLQNLDEQMDDLERGMRIKHSDLKMGELLGKGSYGKVSK